MKKFNVSFNLTEIIYSTINYLVEAGSESEAVKKMQEHFGGSFPSGGCLNEAHQHEHDSEEKGIEFDHNRFIDSCFELTDM